MRYLLDVNVLISLGYQGHTFHHRVSNWLASLAPPATELLTCSITELAFVRIMSQSPFDFDVPETLALLARLKVSGALAFSFVADANNATLLPAWVKSSRQVTDGHLVRLAREHGAVFATLDRGIPGALLIP